MTDLRLPRTQAFAPQATVAAPRRLPHPAVLTLLGILVPVIGYVLLPMLGVTAFVENFSINKIVMLFGLTIAGFAYVAYFRYVLVRPQLLLLFFTAAWVVVNYFNQLLLDFTPVNIHLRPLLFVATGVPCLWYAFTKGREITQIAPYFKYYAAFFVWLFLYFIFFNGNAVDPRFDTGNVWSEGSVGVVQLSSYFYCLMAIVVPAYCALKLRNFSHFFDSLNKILLLVTAIESIITIIGYPLDMFSMQLDGFKRAFGLFSHPNPFAHHMGILLVYFLGLFCYYQGPYKHRMPGLLLLGGLAINLVAFLLGMSKSGLAVFAMCATLLFLLNLSSPVVRRSFLQIFAAMIIIVPVGLFAYQAVNDQSFFSILEARIDQTQSLDWRTEVWAELMADINGATMWLGHGFTAANAFIFQMGFNDETNAKPLMMVHNGYIALIYDLGVMGYLMFAAVISLAFNTLSRMLRCGNSLEKPLYTAILALCLYFMVVCALDEMTYMFDAPILFWSFTTMMFCLALKSGREAQP